MNPGYLERKNISKKQIPGNRNQLCYRRHDACRSLETQFKDQQHCCMTALPSPWLARVQIEKTVKLKEWIQISSLILLSTHKKNPQNNNNPPTHTHNNKKKTHIFVSVAKWADSWHSHPDLFIWVEWQIKELDVLCSRAQCQEEAERNETLKYLYCKLNLPGSPRMLEVKPWLTSDSLNGKSNIYGKVFIP